MNFFFVYDILYTKNLSLFENTSLELKSLFHHLHKDFVSKRMVDVSFILSQEHSATGTGPGS